ncbi:GTP-binding protein [Nocardioides sp. J2M5]|uniref:CobW family GTP-binding protein n=1 Tax=Nocardioides palaemonis TaxID=2829810 RepID=UPI001BA72A5E|nr:GTP-binding protein [Nocardioides palaemonis]MBS2938414.1 GTP-binding protein [Nocardioides palaemonis]
MRTRVLVVTGVDPVAMDSTLMTLAWDLPSAVSVRHRIDPHSQVLTRTVSDISGILERVEVQLEHACVSCALREDILPTLERLARDRRWSSIVAGLPLGTEAQQLAHALGNDTRLARHLQLSSIVAAVGATNTVGDLLGDALLRERDAHSNPHDDRGVGEVACAQVELADHVVLDADPGPESLDLVRAIARPGVPVVTDVATLDVGEIASGRHHPVLARTWCDPELDAPVPDLGESRAWRLDLRSSRPLHPDRLLDRIEDLGSGPFRSRGTFWVPTRPGDMLEWSGAGGQLSIGGYSPWGRRTPMTRLLYTGLGTPPSDLRTAFEAVLVTPAESVEQQRWDVLEDGLEPWLGDIRDVA